MPDWSRRHALHAAAGVFTTGLTGCNQTTRTGPRQRSSKRPVEDVTVLKVRNVGGVPMVDDDPESTTTTPTSENQRPDGRRGQLLMHLDGPTSELENPPRFRDDVPGASDIADFVTATDFETESVYLVQTTIEECYDRHLVLVERDDDGVGADFCRRLRPATVACEADTYDVVAFAIRLPFPMDDLSSLGLGSSSSCAGPRGDPIEPDTSLVVGEPGDSE